MRPVIEKKKFKFIHVIYILIVIICIIAIGVGVYVQFYKDEKLGVIIGITKEEEDEEIKNIKENFLNTFNNNIEIVQEYPENIDKIRKNDDIIVVGENIEEKTEKYTIDIKIPYFNINTDVARELNRRIKLFRDKAESVRTSKSKNNIIYNVKFKAYVNNNFLSLVVLSELKEGDNSQRIIIQSYNYDLEKNSQISMDDIINKKGIDINVANKLIKDEVNSSQEQNIKLKELGYDITIRDVNSEEYDIKNAKVYYIGSKGYLYVIYAYGNKEFTSEMNIVVIK